VGSVTARGNVYATGSAYAGGNKLATEKYVDNKTANTPTSSTTP